MLSRWSDFGPLGRYASRNAGSFDGLDELRREMNRLFFDFETGFGPGEVNGGGWPAATLQDTGAALVVRAEVPGLSLDKLELTADENTLTVKGERDDRVPEGYSVHRKERAAYRFARTFSLPSKVDASQAQAEVKNGVLTVTLPKAKEAQPRQISVRAS
jgi:HSP20 family protein